MRGGGVVMALWGPDKRGPVTAARIVNIHVGGLTACGVLQTSSSNPQNRRSEGKIEGPRRVSPRRGRATFSRYSQEGNAPMMTYALTPDNPGAI